MNKTKSTEEREFDNKLYEIEILTALAGSVSKFRDDLTRDQDFCLLEEIIVQLRYLLLMKSIPFKDFRK